MSNVARIFFLLFLSQQIAFASPMGNVIPITPDTDKTPGELCSKQDKDFLELRYPENMPYCVRKVSQWQKDRIYDLYGIPEKCRHRYTVDHLVPLAVGGNNAFENLWPEHVRVKETRQALELELYHDVRNGHMKSKEAVDIILQVKLFLQLDLSDINGCG